MNVVDMLMKIGFTESMALVYIKLLKNPGFNGTQIHKELNIPRTSVYKALEDLLEKGYINLIPNSDNLKNYDPVKPSEIVTNLSNMYKEIFDNIGLELEKIYSPNKFYNVYNISGIDNIYYRVNEMLKNAKSSIIITKGIDMQRVSSLNFNILNIRAEEKETYVITDNEEIIVFNGISGIYTKNRIILEKYMGE